MIYASIENFNSKPIYLSRFIHFNISQIFRSKVVIVAIYFGVLCVCVCPCRTLLLLYLVWLLLKLNYSTLNNYKTLAHTVYDTHVYRWFPCVSNFLWRFNHNFSPVFISNSFDLVAYLPNARFCVLIFFSPEYF